VYTVSYDLVPYWSIVAKGVKEFLDYFFAAGNTFDPRWLPPRQGRTRVLYLHGGLHLVRRWDGAAAKIINDGRNLLEQFGGPGQAEPLFVSEGTAGDKREAIRRSDYLSFAYEQLSTDAGPFVVYGVGLGAQDAHIASALDRSEVKIAIGLHGADDASLKTAAAGYLQALPHTSPVFFRSSTHPLGDPGLKATEPGEPADVNAQELDTEYDELAKELFGDDWPIPG
jgi:hypothetical protein